MDEVTHVLDNGFLLDYRLVTPPTFTSDYIESQHKVATLDTNAVTTQTPPVIKFQ